ncbi:hypothetical protein GCM10020358_06680 [Amorphoplanes nipponensis]|uniref:Uncharacterized protein n=1 Tax=Actinoplanes nipponensis TaxID=135950 RepID=A0A919JJ36_9ACTN|nr:hypothetical protein [Actinoplanes nipponensis]GIE50146.1 hypothetical protein Ani05nite_36800 [Actinoplanes nipponensis]
MSTPAGPVTKPRVVVIALSYKLTTRVKSYVQDLVDAGVDVDLLVAESSSTQDADLDPQVRVHRVLDVEASDITIRRIERGLLFTLPAKAFGKARSLTVGRPALKKVDAGLALTRRAQSKVSKGIHKKMFWPTFRVMRPLILSRRGQGPAVDLDLAHADRIVAADQPAVPLAWRLSRRYPGVRTTTALDRKPYVGDK